MDLPSTLVVQLDKILDALVPDPDGLSTAVSDLVETVGAAISSFCGLDLSLNHAGQRVGLSVFDEATAASISSSLRWRLNGVGHRQPDQLILYAGRAGAFVDLTADLRYALKGHRSPTLLDADFELDRDLPPRTTTTALTGVTELALLNRAAGVLIDQGAHPQDAQAELERQASAAGLDRYAYARHLLRPPDPPTPSPA